jgi:hypothetical protein
MCPASTEIAIVRAVTSGVGPERAECAHLSLVCEGSEVVTGAPFLLKKVALRWAIGRPLPVCRSLAVTFDPSRRDPVIESTIHVENESSRTNLTVKWVSSNDARVTCVATNEVVYPRKGINLPLRVEVTDCSNWECVLTVHTDSLEKSTLTVTLSVNCQQAVLRCPLVVAAGMMGVVTPGGATVVVNVEVAARSMQEFSDMVRGPVAHLDVRTSEPMFKFNSVTAAGMDRLNAAVTVFERRSEETGLRLVVGGKPHPVPYGIQVGVCFLGVRWG